MRAFINVVSSGGYFLWISRKLTGSGNEMHKYKDNG